MNRNYCDRKSDEEKDSKDKDEDAKYRKEEAN